MTVLVVAAHPDDEVLGVGGTIARHVDQGEQVHILILGEGATSRDGSQGDVQKLREAACEAASVLGAESPHFAALPDNRLDTIALLDLVQAIEASVQSITPTTVYTHARCDLNVDHELVSRAVATACRPLPESNVQAIYAFETPSSTEWGQSPFSPSRFVNISEQFARKREALGHYSSEMRAFPHARSLEAVEALARWRGTTAGVPLAEAFETVRVVDK
jgi:LmbE family N-acetylglucosaminyl deacetylase